MDILQSIKNYFKELLVLEEEYGPYEGLESSYTVTIPKKRGRPRKKDPVILKKK